MDAATAAAQKRQVRGMPQTYPSIPAHLDQSVHHVHWKSTPPFMTILLVLILLVITADLIVDVLAYVNH